MSKQFQLLHTLITLEADQEELQPALDFVSQDARQTHPVRQETVISIQADRYGYCVSRDSHRYEVGPSTWDMVYTLLRLIHEQALRTVPDCIRVHSGCADYQGARFMVIGDKGAGKTTLMLRMLFDREGFEVSGDEMVLINGNSAMPFPRRFHVKSGNASLVPEIGPCLEKSPGFQVERSRWLYGFSPAEAGFSWNIMSRPIRAIFFLIPNHGGESWVEECSGLRMIRHMMPMSYFSETKDHEKIQTLCRLSMVVKSFCLHVGNLDKAVAIIRYQMSLFEKCSNNGDLMTEHIDKRALKRAW